MKKVIEFFKNRIVISIIGLIVLSLLIWFLGPLIKFGDDNFAPLGGEVTRLIVIMVIILLWGLNNLRIQMQNKKHNESLVNDLQSSPAGGGVVSSQKSEEMQQISERFTDALAVVKKYKFKGFGSQKGLYELPWYIIIGPPGAGKTTALVNSSLDFPLAEKIGKGALRGIGGTRNCDWWFTNEAVLIDTAGRYTTQDSHKVVDSAAWEGFLDLLKKHRRRRPINGAIVAISVQDLLMQTEEEKMAHVRTIRSRIDELMDKLGVRFPIYLMFTKCDLISGFSEFFEDLSKDDREQVLGISLPNAPKPMQSPDFEFLQAEYNKLIKRLYERVIWRVHQERDAARRGAIQGFPQQMENMQKTVMEFVQQTFIKNRYRFQPYLRGIYFTSGVQDGTPIDRLMSAVSVNFGFDRQLVQTGLAQGKSYFLGQLFRSVIFPESELVGSDRKYETFIKWTQQAAYVGMAVLTVIMFIVWTSAITRNEMYMNEVGTYVADFYAEINRQNTWSNDMRVVLPSLNALKQASTVYDKDSNLWLSSLGMYDGNVDSAADEAYTAQLSKVLLPRLMKYLEANLRKSQSSEELYSAFRVYLMMNKTKYLDKKAVQEWFVGNWERDFSAQVEARGELRMHLEALLAQKLPPAPISQDLVRSVRSMLQGVPLAQRIYSGIRSNPRFAQRINYMEQVGDAVRSTYTVNDSVAQGLSIPVLFTKEAYDHISFSPDSDLIITSAREKWVLSDDENVAAQVVNEDLKEVSNKVKEYYMADYRSHWLNFYNVLNVKSFQNIQQANEVLTRITDPVQSPLIAIIQIGAKNTQLTNEILANTVDDAKGGTKGKAAAFLASQVEFTPVDKQFRPLNLLLRETQQSPAKINEVMQKIYQLKEFVNEISISPEPSKKALEIAKQRYQGGGNAITATMIYGKSMPDPLSRWLNGLAQETWRVILQSAHQQVNSEWRTQVYSQCASALAGKYPLNSAAKEEVAIQDFTEFFKPGGTVDKFSAEFIKPFVDMGQGWSNRGVDNYSLGISGNAIAQLKKANDIKTVFFSENPGMPTVTFQLKPFDMKKTDARFTLEIGEKRIVYSHGPKLWETLTWSAENSNRVRIIFEDLYERQHIATFEGPWAWFRLQDRSKLTPATSNTYYVTYSIEEGVRVDVDPSAIRAAGISHSIQYEIKAKSVNNPFKKDLLGSFRCPEGV